MESLKYVQIETSTTCNQRCYFCPVSTKKRPKSQMSLDVLELIMDKLTPYSGGIEKIYISGFNEPTVDKTLVEKVNILNHYKYQVQLNTNASGLTPNLLNQLLESNLKNICLNFSSVEPNYYQATRKYHDVDKIKNNIKYLLEVKDLSVKVEMLILGELDEQHAENIQEIFKYFGTNNIQLNICPTINYAYIDNNIKLSVEKTEYLSGCMSQRLDEWLHFIPTGQVVMCNQDYHNSYVVGDITKQSVEDIYNGSRITKIRNWNTGKQVAPSDFICRSCLFAISSTETFKDKLKKIFCDNCILSKKLGKTNSCCYCMVFSSVC